MSSGGVASNLEGDTLTEAGPMRAVPSNQTELLLASRGCGQRVSYAARR